MATVRFQLFDKNNNSVSILNDEAGKEGGIPDAHYTFEESSENSSGGEIKQQRRPGKRFIDSYIMHLPLTKYIDYTNLITNNAQDYFINYTNIPCVLDNNPTIITNNQFEVALRNGFPTEVAGAPIIFIFTLEIASVQLL